MQRKTSCWQCYFQNRRVSSRAPPEFTVAVYRNPVEPKIRLQQVAKWTEPNTKEGPAGITKRQKVRTLLGKCAADPDHA